MKLSTKLPLASATGVALLLASALYGMLSLNRAIDTYRTTVQARAADERAVKQMLLDFKVQVQEWKDTLLRGKDPVKLSAYWSAFEKQEAKVNEGVNALQSSMQPGENLELVKNGRWLCLVV